MKPVPYQIQLIVFGVLTICSPKNIITSTLSDTSCRFTSHLFSNDYIFEVAIVGSGI